MFPKTRVFPVPCDSYPIPYSFLNPRRSLSAFLRSRALALRRRWQALVVVDSNSSAGPLVDLSQIAPPVPVRKTLMVVNQVHCGAAHSLHSVLRVKIIRFHAYTSMK